ncbi:GNAT family N-acetyltransferase [Smaragdicoccus niigatensis]|uniref:GNAT family N-acetyltransferase n=1 Tax=Smaragdicoccus niigatensis TaxID=359359 RepID=UPI00037F64AD|nr:GNAT family N-acetyltransferase [Smaragdicoccus niigatensis]
MDISIRPAHLDDIAALQDAEERAATVFADTTSSYAVALPVLSAEFLAQQITDKRVWVAAHQEVVGFAVATLIDGTPHLHELDVVPEYARRGIGKLLIETVKTWAASNGHSALTLSTFRDIPWNAPFYAKVGFTEVTQLTPGLEQLRSQERAVGLDLDNRIVMRLAIGS